MEETKKAWMRVGFGVTIGLGMALMLVLIVSNGLRFGEAKWRIVTIEDTSEDGTVSEGFFEVDEEGRVREIEAASYDDSRQYYLECLEWYEDEEGEIVEVKIVECDVFRGKQGLLADVEEGAIMEIKDTVAEMVYERYAGSGWHLWMVEEEGWWWVIVNGDDGTAEIFRYEDELREEFRVENKYVEYVQAV